MISIIICSRTPEIPGSLKTNIATTIGIPYELIIIDNSGAEYSICEAYNAGVQKSNFPFLCFMHDDILFHSVNWGKTAVDYFNDEQTGAIGIAGSPYATQMPGSWWGGGLISQQLLVNDKGILTQHPVSVRADISGKNEVVLIDGIWMCARRSLFDNIRFDAQSFTGFHFYDLDISLQIACKGYKLYCVFDIAVQHFSKGNMDEVWVTEALVFQKKWRKTLPVSCISLNYNEKCEAEHKTLTELLNVLKAKKVAGKKIYLLAVSQLSRFYQGYCYYKTPLYFVYYLFSYLKAAK